MFILTLHTFRKKDWLLFMRLALIGLAVVLVLFSCTNQNELLEDQVTTNEVVEEAFSDADSATFIYTQWFAGLNPQEQDSLLTDLATFITRKPATAQTISKFDAQFRSFYIKKRGELEFLYASKIEGKVHFYVLREARDANGAQQRGVGGVYRYDDQGNLVDFEELFNTRILPKNELERIGLTYMKVHNDEKLLAEFIADKTNIEWPDGRLFYSKEKHEWRYVE